LEKETRWIKQRRDLPTEARRQAQYEVDYGEYKRLGKIPDEDKTDQQCLRVKKSLDLQERHQETIKDGRLLDESKKEDALKKSCEARSKSIDDGYRNHDCR